MKPMVLPWSEDGRAAGWPPAILISFVGSSTRNVICCTPARSCGPLGPQYLALRGLAIDADPHRRRYRLGLAAHPGRNDGTEAAGGAPSSHDQEMIRRFECCMHALAAVAHNGALSDRRPFGTAHARTLVQEVADVTLRPTRSLDMFAELFWNHN